MVNLRSLSFIIGAILCLGAFASCRANSPKEIDFTEEEAREFLKVGVERSTITARFGEPVTEARAEDGSVVLVYLRPFVVTGEKPSPAPIHFSGFQVFLRDNKVVRWDAITSDAPER